MLGTTLADDRRTIYGPQMSRRVASLVGSVVWLAPTLAWAADGTGREVVDRGVSGVWVLANISYAGMRAQDHPSAKWRIAAFIFGFPGTLVSFLCVGERSNHAYGVRLPPRAP